MNTLTSDVEWFLGHCADHRKLSSHTLRAYQLDLQRFSRFAENIPTAAIDRAVIQRWLGEMNGVKPRTMRRRLAALKSMFSTLDRHGKLLNNQLAGFRSEIKVGKSLPRIVGRSTIRALLRSARKGPAPTPKSGLRRIRDMALIELLFSTGMRVSEAAAANLLWIGW
jgi:integrase/recombinase XerD